MLVEQGGRPRREIVREGKAKEQSSSWSVALAPAAAKSESATECGHWQLIVAAVGGGQPVATAEEVARSCLHAELVARRPSATVGLLLLQCCPDHPTSSPSDTAPSYWFHLLAAHYSPRSTAAVA